MNDVDWMTRAYELALVAQSLGEVPVGAVLVSADNQCLGEGYNQVITLNDPTAHAEMLALRHATTRQKNHRLLNTTLYVTLEPCSMCAGALVHARIARLVFATRDFKTGCAGSILNLVAHPLLNHQIRIDEGVLQMPAAALLSQFFQSKRS